MKGRRIHRAPKGWNSRQPRLVLEPEYQEYQRARERVEALRSPKIAQGGAA